jgi:hypothetical protein
LDIELGQQGASARSTGTQEAGKSGAGKDGEHSWLMKTNIPRIEIPLKQTAGLTRPFLSEL